MGEQLPFLIKMCPNHLADLDAALRFYGDVAVGELSCDDNIAVAEFDDVAGGVDVGDEEVLVCLDAIGVVVQVGAHIEALDLATDRPTFGLYLNLHAGPRFCTFGDLDCIEVQVGRRAGQSLHGDASHRDLLDQLLVVRIERIEAVNFGVRDLVSCRVAQHHERTEPRQCFQ
ncbi:Uncharacterised protein [Mycobacteroides abscessus subsp. abscessus]|nr:Uncharacterised protein [Mycobacteroides abscessus subsp. abscessus]SKR84447.1 Uncharacterised protein [Mycobacteroides abscessus subsp. abscessus]